MKSIKVESESRTTKTRGVTILGLVTLLGVCSITAWTIPQMNSAFAILGSVTQECYTIGGQGGNGAGGGAGGSSDGSSSGPGGTGGAGGAGGAGGEGEGGGAGGAGGTGGQGGNSGEGGAGGDSSGGEGGEGGRGGDGDVVCIVDDSFRSRTTIIQNTLSPSMTGLSSGMIGPIAPIIPIP